MRGQEKRDWEKKKLDRQGRKIQIIALGSSLVSGPVIFGQKYKKCKGGCFTYVSAVFFQGGCRWESAFVHAGNEDV